MSSEKRIDIEKPYWDQSTYRGRALHFLTVTNPLNLFASNKALERARNIVTRYRNGETLAELSINEEELWKQKYLFDSAYHPDTGEKMILIGRMSAQVPMNMTITGLMMTFYKSTPAVIFWQWFNQSFNAIVNYTNRSGKSPIPKETLIQSYISATGGAVITALSLNRLARRGPALAGRLVPLAAVAAANCVNIPLMRITELQNGIELQNESGIEVGKSKSTAQKAIATVTLSRILMASPSMSTMIDKYIYNLVMTNLNLQDNNQIYIKIIILLFITVISPIIMNYIEKQNLLQKVKWASAPIQVIICGICLTFATPLCCALFIQRVPISVDKLELVVQKKIRSQDPAIQTVYYNKGL